MKVVFGVFLLWWFVIVWSVPGVFFISLVLVVSLLFFSVVCGVGVVVFFGGVWCGCGGFFSDVWLFEEEPNFVTRVTKWWADLKLCR